MQTTCSFIYGEYQLCISKFVFRDGLFKGSVRCKLLFFRPNISDLLFRCISERCPISRMSAGGNKKRSIASDASIESQFQILQTIARNQLLQFRSWRNQLGQNIMSNYAAIHPLMPLSLTFTISTNITVLFLVSLKRRLFTNLTHLAIFDPIMTFRFTGGHISPWVEDSESSVLCLQMKDHQ